MIEVLIAIVIFVLAALPIYFALSEGAVKEFESTKVAMARKILESFRQEIISRPYEEVVKLIPVDKPKEEFIPYTVDGLILNKFDVTASSVMGVQKQFKDFEFTSEFRLSPSNPLVIEIKGKVIWTKGRSSGKATTPPKSQETISFLLVKP